MAQNRNLRYSSLLYPAFCNGIMKCRSGLIKKSTGPKKERNEGSENRNTLFIPEKERPAVLSGKGIGESGIFGQAGVMQAAFPSAWRNPAARHPRAVLRKKISTTKAGQPSKMPCCPAGYKSSYMGTQLTGGPFFCPFF